MSRVKRFAHSLASGYFLLGANSVYTIFSIPLALHYLTTEEFGLWAVITQVAGYLQLVDLGMSGSVSRILIDHKDDETSTRYGEVFQTGLVVLLLQGAIIVLGGSLFSFWMPEMMKVPEKFWAIVRILLIGQCALLGVAFAGRIFGHVLQAHQRYDIHNYSQVAGLVANLVVLWLGFHLHWGLYSLLAAGSAAVFVGMGYCAVATARLGLLPPRRRWGRPNWKTFKELFSFGSDLFLMTIGEMLVNASQAVIITRVLGLETVTVWSIATKAFTLAQQMVWRMLAFSSAAFSEMIVRGERKRLLARYRDLVVLSASSGVLVGLVVALCNQSFLKVWVHGSVSWPVANDLLMGLSVAVYSMTRCYRGLVGFTKDIGAMKYVYLAEGAACVGLGYLGAHYLGLAGVILAGIVTSLLGSGLYGGWRAMQYFEISARQVFLDWLKPALWLGLALLGVGVIPWYATRQLPAIFQLAVNAIILGSFGLLAFWRIGLPSHIREELGGLIARLRGRLAAARPSKAA